MVEKWTEMKYSLLYCLAGILVAGSTVLQPVFLKEILDQSGNAGQVVVMVALYVLTIIAILIFEGVSKWASVQILIQVKRKYIAKIIGWVSRDEYIEQDEETRAKISVDLNTNIDEIVENYYINRLLILTNIVSIVFFGVSILTMDYFMMILILLPNVVTVFLPKIMEGRMADKKKQMISASVTFNEGVGVFWRRINVIKNALLLPQYKKQLDDARESYLRRVYQYGITQSAAEILMGFTSYVGVFLIIVYGAYGIFTGRLTAGIVAASLEYCELIAVPIVNLCIALNRRTAGKEVLAEVQQRYEEFRGINRTCEKKPFKELRMREVSCDYDGKREVLNIDKFKISLGQKIALVGDNGTGKSTLLKVIYKAIVPTKGDIQLNGIQYDKLTFVDLSTYFTFIKQDNDIGEERMEVLVKQIDTKVLDEIKQLKDMDLSFIYDTSKMSSELSGGEKQVLSIILAMSQGKNFLIMDESLNEVQKNQRKALLDWISEKKDLAVLYVTHEMNDINNKFEIIRMAEGTLC